jgi:hypothetical protein
MNENEEDEEDKDREESPLYTEDEIERSQSLIEAVLGPEEVAKLKDDR